MSSCAMLKLAGIVVAGTGVAAEVVSAPGSELVSAWERLGMVGVLLVIVAALWYKSDKDQKANEAYRERREKAEAERQARMEEIEHMKAERADKRNAEFVAALNELSATQRESSIRCGDTRHAMEKAAERLAAR